MAKNSELVRAQLQSKDCEILEEEVAFQGFFRMVKKRLKHRLFAGGWGNTIEREILVRGPAAAAILYDPQNDLLALVDQFRAGALDSEFGPWCLEVVAGMIEADESPEAVVSREVEEEAGICATRLIPIASYYSSPGGCDEIIHLFCALCDLSGAGGTIHGLDEENEDILLHVLDPDTVFDSMLKDRTNNATTIIALQWLQMHRQNLIESV